MDGWQEYSFIGTSSSSYTTFENYDLTLDSTTGSPAPSAHISGDGYESRSGIYKIVDISSINNNSPLYLSFDYRATSVYPDVTLTNTHLEVYDEVTGDKLYTEALIVEGTRDSGWQRYSTDISSITSGYDSIKIVLHVSDRGYGDFDQQNWYDNITLGTYLIDNIAPIITTSPSEITLEVGTTTAPDLLDGVTTDDGSDITITGTVDTNLIGTYSIFYDSTDESDNHAIQVSRIYSVVETITQSSLTDTFDDSLDGWQEYSFTEAKGPSQPFENYDLTLDSTTGSPAPSAHISGDGFAAKSGIQKNSRHFIC